MPLRSKKIVLDQYSAVAIRLGWMLLLLWLSRFIFYAINHNQFSGISTRNWLRMAWGGLRFDIAAVCYINVLWALLELLPFPFRYRSGYQRASRLLFVLLNGTALLINTADMAYYQFTLRRSTAMILQEFQYENNLAFTTLKSAITFWYLFLVFGALLFLLIYGYNKIEVRKPALLKPLKFYGGAMGAFLLFPVLFVGGIRGDWKYTTRPITMSNAGEYVTRPEEISLVLNTPFCVLRTWRQQFYSLDSFYQEPELSDHYSPLHVSQDTSSFRYDNVVILIVESLGREAVGSLNKGLEKGHYQGYTPFIDSLAKHSFLCENGFANGRKSIDALPAVLTGIPAGELPFVLTPYVSNQIQSLPAILQSKGYHTSFFHGAPNGSMGFKAFVNLIGVQQYFGKDEYNNDSDFDGTWGIWDEPFLQFFANRLQQFKEPFFSTLFTVTSHEPFFVPRQYKGKFPKGTLPLHEVTGYTDNAIRKFFVTASTMPWFKRTLFVITADHASLSSHPEYQTAWGNMAIPILFYHPSDSLQKRTDRLVQQTDIMPTVLSFLGYHKSFLAFGKNVLNDPSDDFVINYHGGFQLFQGQYLFQLTGSRASGLFDFRADPLLKQNLLTAKPEIAKPMEQKLKAFMQQYHNRLIQNDLLPPQP